MEGFLLEHNNLAADVPSDLDTAFVGKRISVKADRIAIIINMGDSTAAVVNFSLLQHDAASAGNSKALAIANKYFYKAGAATVFTAVEPTSAASSFDVSTQFAAQEGILVLEVLQEDLDVNNNFSHISVTAADTTAAKIGSVVYLARGVPFKAAYSETL